MGPTVSEGEAAAVRAEADAGSAAKIHLPEPSVWPAVLAGGITLLTFGVVSNLTFSAAGLLLIAGALAGWIRELCRPSHKPPSTGSAAILAVPHPTQIQQDPGATGQSPQ